MMIRAGVLILLFVAYQLWGTGLHTSQAQDELSTAPASSYPIIWMTGLIF